MLKLKIVYIHLRGTWNFKHSGCLYNIIYSPGGDKEDNVFVEDRNKDKNNICNVIKCEKEDKNREENDDKDKNRDIKERKNKKEKDNVKESKSIENIVYKCESGGVARNDRNYFGKKDTPPHFLPILFSGGINK